MDTTTLLDCGHAPTVTEGPGTGVAYDDNNRSMCYACADNRACEQITRGEPITLYHGRERTVTTWSGGVLGHVRWQNVTRGTTPSGGQYETVSVNVVMFDGSKWHGRGPGEGMYLHLRKNKKQA